MHKFFNKIIFCLLVALLGQGVLAAQAPASVSVKNEEAINSGELEFSPTFFEDGIVFISTNSAGMKKLKDRRLKTKAMSILLSRRGVEGGLQVPEPFSKEVTSRYHEGPVCFNPTADSMYFSRNVVIDGREKKASDGELKMNIYLSAFTGAEWTEGTPLSFNSKEFDDCHPSISIEGDKLVFASNRDGGFGGMDLYVSFRLGSEWSEPINLGPSINTEKNEAFPFLHADNTLYFASDGLDGKGGFDMFYALFDGSNWLAPANIGPPFNTTGDDLGLIVDLNKINGYYTSNGNGGAGQDDIFSFYVENGNLDNFLLQNNRITDQKLDVLVSSADPNGVSVEGANVRIINLDRSNIVGRDSLGNAIILENVDGQDVLSSLPSDAIITGFTNENGTFSTDLSPGNYLFMVSKDAYETTQLVRLINHPGNFINTTLEPATKGKLPFQTILYNDATDAPLAGAMLVLKNATTGELDTIYTDENGAVDSYLEKDIKYKVNIYKNGLLVGETELDTSTWPDNGLTGDAGGKLNMVLNISAPPLPDGTVIELPNIYYNFNDATLRPDAKKDLDLVAALLKQYPAITLQIGSHTDSRGTNEYNLSLSQKRAENVLEFLASNGVDPDRMKPIGFGEKNLRNHCTNSVNCDEKEHARNRRTEITVLSGANDVQVKRYDSSLGLGPSGSGVPTGSGQKSAVPSFSENTAFYVVAGSFLMESRAKNRLAQVQQAGYSNAKIRQFGDSPFYAVCVELYDDYNKALSEKKVFERKEKINTYVKPINK